MDEAGDIVAVSLPFVAGVATAAAMGPSAACAAAAGLGTAILMATAVLFRDRCAFPILALFFFAGLLCYSVHALVGMPSHGSGHTWPFSTASRALGWLTTSIDALPFPHGTTNALAKALLTGQRQDLGHDVVATFRQSGASHILALSGLHLGVIYGILLKVLAVLGNSRAGMIAKSTAAIGACGFYTLMTGAGPSIVRAFLFIVLNELARHAPGRRRSSLAIFCTALIVQLTFQPTVITSLGFQLSYLAMLGIFLVHPRLEAWYPASGSKRLSSLDLMHRIWTSASLTISCQLFTAPLVWLRFHTFPEYFLLTNLLALPVAEAFILCALACLCAHAAGFCPAFLITATDGLAQCLQFCLEVISGM